MVVAAEPRSGGPPSVFVHSVGVQPFGLAQVMVVVKVVVELVGFEGQRGVKGHVLVLLC